MSGSEKKVNRQNTYISSVKRVTRKFQEVSGSFTFYSFKTTAKKCTKKRAKLFFAS